MNLRSDLGKVKGLGSAKSGFHHWWLQRLTAIAIIPISIWFVVGLIQNLNSTYDELVAWIGTPLVTVLMLSLICGVFYHAKLGVQVVVEDYIHSELPKVCLIILVNLGLAFGALVGIFSVLKIALGTNI